MPRGRRILSDSSKAIRCSSQSSPSICGVKFCCDDVQRVPRRNAEAIVETEHEDHHRLAGAEPEEEAADA